MTKLTEDVHKALIEPHAGDTLITAELIAEVCKGYIERAFDAGVHYTVSLDSTNEEDRNAWLKENGVIE